jgi:hypothetical protein
MWYAFSRREAAVFKEGCAMRRPISLLLVVLFLPACAGVSRRSESSAEPAPPLPEKVTPETVAAPVGKAETGLEKTYRSSLPVCFDGALKVCRERDCRVGRQERTDQAATLSANGRAFEYSLTFSRTPDNRTRVVVRVQGRAAPENRDEGLSLLNKLSETLLEPKD